jgi:hypothetical protein
MSFIATTGIDNVHIKIISLQIAFTRQKGHKTQKDHTKLVNPR